MTRAFQITGLNCAACVGRAEAALAGIPGASGAQVNLASHSGRVTGATVAQIETALGQAGYPARRVTTRLSVPDMHCGSCVARAEAAAAQADGVLTARANLADRSIIIEALAGDTEALRAAQAALAEAGYPADAPQQAEADAEADHALDARQRFVIAAVLTLPVFVLEMGSHMIPALHHFVMRTIGMQTAQIGSMLLTFAVLAWPGRQFFARGVPGLLKARPDMDALVALGTGAAFAFSAVSTLAPGLLPPGSAAVYFEAAAVIVTLILLGRWLEAKARARTGDAVRALLNLAPDTAMVLQDGGAVETPLSAITPGMDILLRPGARVPVDGRVTDGAGYVDESMLTGEPIPVAKTTGDQVRAGCVNGTGTLTVTATATGADTALARIVQMTRDAQAARLPVQEVINRITAVFVPAVMLISALTLLVWLAVGGGLGNAIVAAVSVLIIACPCAMGLATPVSIMVGTGRAAQQGVLFRNGAALQRLGEVDWIAFDKTGTLTKGAPKLTDQAFAPDIDPEALMSQVAALEAQSEHPIARALAEGADGSVPVTGFKAIVGQGACGVVAGRAMRVGNAAFVGDVDFGPLAATAAGYAAQGATPIYVVQDDQPAAVLAVSDPLRADAKDALDSLKTKGLNLALMSGDVAPAVQHAAQHLPLDVVHAALDPQGKIDALRGLPGPAAFVGDGINDAPVLAAAEVGLAVAGATDVAGEQAGVVLLAPGPAPVARAVALSRATMRNIRQNLAWAFGYNVLLIPVAAGALVPLGGPMLSPALAGGAMALSSVAVVLNALRLRSA